MRVLLSLFLVLITALPARPQGSESDRLIVATVTRPPFSMTVDGAETGFALDLWAALSAELGLVYDVRRYASFPDMLAAVEAGEANAAVANISITADRETRMDFTQPIFSAGVQVLMTSETGIWPMLRAAFSPRLLLLGLLAIGGLFALGMLMWAFERRRHDYFGTDARSAAFPAFWWALNVLISGDYKEKDPASPLGRVFGVLMIVGSLFVVSIFVAQITANLTLDAINQDVARITDLDGRKVGTTEGSTTATYLETRRVAHQTYADLATLQNAFEGGEIDAIAFDGPVLAYYLQSTPDLDARLIDRVFQREYYGIALPTGSDLRERINRALLRLEEDGTYGEIQRTWFGASYTDR
ncbi:transporter substrate-binding domain-containing protein [Jannaschia marina]|uniref:transporter substrate-binding domain-containing protein n=1 Tax=Jannaschia marina TaxID=2741674 RepID=UPI0015C97A5B|nr:transporter substrate-binding domain-containing protein [Jannaschia marina]